MRMEHLERVCRERGLPLTVQRRAVFQVMLDREDHPTADQVYVEIRARLPGVSRASVYRILEMLVGAGMVTKVCHPGSAARFDAEMRPHHHLVCVSCEHIIDVEAPDAGAVPVPDVGLRGFQINDCQVQFRGTCAECLRKQRVKTNLVDLPGRPKAGRKSISPKRPSDKERKTS